jgi:hypothetical protein
MREQCYLNSEVAMTANIKITVFWGVAPCSLNYRSQIIESYITENCS